MHKARSILTSLCQWATVAVTVPSPVGQEQPPHLAAPTSPVALSRAVALAAQEFQVTRILLASMPSSWAALLETPPGPGQRSGCCNLPFSSSGTWQADDNVVSRRNAQRRRLSSSSLEDSENRPCVWGPLAV